tara:strand:+ start:78 stop:1910 length:1833 start_codon:yes stop_codon:yes gene_type:complete
MADIKDKLPTPPGEGDSKKGGVSHGVMSKSFGLQRKTLARVIGLEKRVDKIEADGQGGIDPDKFSEINQGIAAINSNLSSIKEFIDADLLAQQQAADDKKKDDSRKADSKKKLDAEKFLEQKQETKLLKPAVKVAENTKSVFQRLFDALTGIFAGWLFDKGGKLITAWSEGDTEQFNKMKNQIIGALAVVGGIFAVANIGAIIASMKLLIGGLKVGVPMVLGLLANPWTWVVLGVGTGLYFGIKALDKRITGGGSFKDFDKQLRAKTKASGIDMYSNQKGAHILEEDGKSHKRIDYWGEHGLMGRDATEEEMQDLNYSENRRVKLNLKDEAHRAWIEEHMGADKLATMDKAFDDYKIMMKKKDDIKDEMHLMLKKEKKLFYAERRLEEKKLRDKGKIGGWNTTKGWTDPLQWMDSSAGRWWAKQDKKWKKRHLEIRAEYAGELKTTFPEFFDGDPSTSAGATFPDDVFMAKSDEETDNMALERHKAMLAEGELSDTDLDADIKELQKNAKGDGPSHLEGQRTTVPLPDGILQPSKQVSRNNNEQKLQSISSSTDDQPNIEVLPVMGQTQQSGQSEPLNRGSAAEIPALMTSNSSNDYRYFYTHIYQQGND